MERVLMIETVNVDGPLTYLLNSMSLEKRRREEKNKTREQKRRK